MNTSQQQQAQQFVQQPSNQGAQKQPAAPAANDEIAKIAQLGYN